MLRLDIMLDIMAAALAVFVMTTIYVRIVGLRSFSKMASVDFAMTIATGSMIATIILPQKPSLLEGLFTIAILFIIQLINSFLRRNFKVFKDASENKPVLIMQNGIVNFSLLKKVNMTLEDLMAKLREANVLEIKEVKAVVFEATGDVSVIHGDKEVDMDILEGVRK